MPLAILRSQAAGFAAGILLSAVTLAAGARLSAQRSSGSLWISLAHHTAAEMSAADAARIQEEHRAIAEEAAFFGYDLSLSGWQMTQAVCPATPDYLLLHYHRAVRNGAQFLFTALVPRGPGRVEVVPVLYRNATPFKSAIGSAHSLSAFNRAVPSSVAEKNLKPEGSWLELGLCYAEIVGAEPRVPRNASMDPALLHAPAPTLRISEKNRTTSVSFTDRNGPHSYTVWDIAFDSRGRVVSASAASLADYVTRVLNGTMPQEKPLPGESQPKIIALPPPTPPQTKPLPH